MHKGSGLIMKAMIGCFKQGAVEEIAKYADGVGPGWYMMIDKKRKSKPNAVVYTTLAKELAKHKLEVHPYTVMARCFTRLF